MEEKEQIYKFYDRFLADLNPDSDRRFDISYLISNQILQKNFPITEEWYREVREKYKKYLDHLSIQNRGKKWKSKPDEIHDFIASGKVDADFGVTQDFRWRFFFGDRSPKQVKEVYERVFRNNT